MNTRRATKVVLEFVFAIAVVAVVLAYAEYGPVPWMPALRWWGLAGATAVTFGYPLRWYRRYWRQGFFWVAYSALLIFHLVIYWWVLTEAHRFGLLWFVIVTPLEWAVICPTLEAVGKSGSPKVG